MNIPDVYVTRVDTPDASMARLFDKLHASNTVSNIAIKINMCDFRPIETGAVSDPAIVRIIINELRRKYNNPKISLVEHDASTARADILFKWLGFQDLAKEMDLQTVNVQNGEWVQVPIEGAKFKIMDVPKVFADADLIISHPKLKTHSFTRLTCSLKNMYGCFKPRYKVPYHSIIDDVIVDVNLAMKPHLTIVDANICHEGFTGPAFGTPKRLGLFIGGNDPVAVDSFCSRFVGNGDKQVSHVIKAEQFGIGTTKYNLVSEVPSSELEKLKLNFDEKKMAAINTLKRIGARLP